MQSLNVLTLVRDRDGNTVRLELNGLELPTVGDYSIDFPRPGQWPQQIVHLTLCVDHIELSDFNTTVDGTIVVEADHLMVEAPQRQIEAARGE